MGRYSPSYYAPLDERDYGAEIADAIGSYAAMKRQEKLDQRAEEEYAYTKRRRETLDPLEEALLHAQLYERGIVPSEGGEEGELSRLPDAIEGQRSLVPDRGRLVPGRGGAGSRGDPGRGLTAPGSFNPATGTFNFVLPQSPDMLDREGPPDMGRLRQPPDMLDRGEGRIRLGAGFDLHPSLTERGRADATKRRMIEALIARGVPREEAELEVLGGLEGAIGEHLHPGPYHPRTMEEALHYEEELIRARGDQDARVAGIRSRAGGARDSDRDPRWEERRKSWVRELGEPTDEMEQDILDALASGYSTAEVLEQLPESRKSRAQRYLRRAIRHERRDAEQPE